MPIPGLIPTKNRLPGGLGNFPRARANLRLGSGGSCDEYHLIFSPIPGLRSSFNRCFAAASRPPWFPGIGPLIYAYNKQNKRVTQLSGSCAPSRRSSPSWISGVLQFSSRRFAVQHGALPHPEKMKIGPIFKPFIPQGLRPISAADNYLPLAHNISMSRQAAKYRSLKELNANGRAEVQNVRDVTGLYHPSRLPPLIRQ